MPAQYRNYVDWNDDGDFSDSREDVTGRTLDGRTPVTIRYGRDQVRQLSPTSPGEMSYELDNTSRDYSPENTASPLNGSVLPGRPVRFQAILNAVTYTMYTGFLDDFTVKPDPSDRSIDVTCVDALGQLRGVEVTTSLYRGVRTGEAIGHLLDAAGWPAALRDLDAGASILPFWWVDGSDAFDALMQLVDSEGPAALATVDGGGRIVFRDRHHRLTRAASTTVQSTWRSSGDVEPLISAPADYQHGWKEVVNRVTFEVPVRQIDFVPSQVWQAQGLIAVASGETIEVTAKGGGPFIDAITPVDGVDYTTMSGFVSVAISRTSGESTTLLITGVGGPAVIQDLTLRATAIQSTTVVVAVEDPASVGKYGRRAWSNNRNPVWASVYDAKAIAELIVGKRSERVPTITVTMLGAGGTARLTQMLTRNLSDRVHVVESHSGLDADCFIEQIAHTVTEGGLEHVTTFGLERIPLTVANPFTFDVAGRGFNDGAFAQIGSDNPATMFRFDTSGQGFDSGVFAF